MIKQIEMYEKFTNGPNNSTISIPFTASGSDIENVMLIKGSISKIEI